MKITDVMSNIVGHYGLASSNRYHISFEFNNDLATATGVRPSSNPSALGEGSISTGAEKLSYLADEVNIPGYSVSTGEFEGHVPGMNQKYAHTKTFRDFSVTFLMDHTHLPYKVMQKWGEYIFPYQSLESVDSEKGKNFQLTNYYDNYACGMTIYKMEHESSPDLPNRNKDLFATGLYLHNVYPYIINDITVSNGPKQPLKFQVSFYYEYARFLSNDEDGLKDIFRNDPTLGANDLLINSTSTSPFA